MDHVEAVLFASPTSAVSQALARVVGPECRLDVLIADTRDELRARPYEFVAIAGCWQLRTRAEFTTVLDEARGAALTAPEQLVLAGIAYVQSVTWLALSRVLAKEMSSDLIEQRKRLDLGRARPRSPEAKAAITHIITPAFLVRLKPRGACSFSASAARASSALTVT